jgi:hypothetical protein
LIGDDWLSMVGAEKVTTNAMAGANEDLLGNLLSGEI